MADAPAPTPVPDRIVIGVDPGLFGAIAGLRVRLAPGQAPRVVAVDVIHAGAYYPRAKGGRIEVVSVGAALHCIVDALIVRGGGHGGPRCERGPLLIEALGLRPGEAVQATVTAAIAWGALRAAVAAQWGADRIREIQPQAVDAALGWGPVGSRQMRKLRNLAQAVAVCEAAGRAPGPLLTPPRGRGMSDGAADAVCIALAGCGVRMVADAPVGAGRDTE